MEAVPGPGEGGAGVGSGAGVQEDDLWTTMEVGCGTGLGGGRDIFKAHLPSGGRTACSSWKRLHHPLTPSWPPLLAECTKPQIVALTLHLLENFPCKIGSLILDPLFSPSVCEQLHEMFVNQVRPALERG